MTSALVGRVAEVVALDRRGTARLAAVPGARAARARPGAAVPRRSRGPAPGAAARAAGRGHRTPDRHAGGGRGRGGAGRRGERRPRRRGRADHTGTRDRAAGRGRPGEPGHRRTAGAVRTHRGDARPPPARQAGARQPDAGFTTDNDRRDRDVRGKRFLDAAQHPTIGLRSTRVVHRAGGWQIIGVLSVGGGSAEATLNLTGIVPTVDGYRLTATATVDRVAAGVRVGRPVIGRYLDITINVCITAD